MAMHFRLVANPMLYPRLCLTKALNHYRWKSFGRVLAATGPTPAEQPAASTVHRPSEAH
ncbi:uncharacterized protein FFM5_14417 [Fusarium fujikuroi]|nr:uncharacterized protein FFM5_14417 [Fusarium fujikuroi]